MDSKFAKQDKAIAELKTNQENIIESIEILKEDSRNNRLHILRLEKNEKFI